MKRVQIIVLTNEGQAGYAAFAEIDEALADRLVYTDIDDLTQTEYEAADQICRKACRIPDDQAISHWKFSVYPGLSSLVSVRV